MTARLKDLVGWTVRSLSVFVPKRDLMLFSSMDGYAGNGRAFYDTVAAAGEPWDLVWLSLDESQDRGFEAYKIPYVNAHGLRALWLIVRARWFASTHGEMARFHTPKRQFYINLWHGLPFKKTGFLWSRGEGEQYRETVGRSDMMPCSSPFSQAVMSSVFHVSADRLVTTGYPRNDPLLDSDAARQRLEQLLGRREGERRILYCPTHRQTLWSGPESSWTFGDFVDRYLSEELLALLRRERVRVVVKLHPFDERRMQEDAIELPEPVELMTTKRLTDARVELYEILAGFDALWTDYSSISCDFLLVERPIFYLVEDLDEYLAGRGVVLDDFPFLAPGPHIRTPGALVSAVERWLREPEMYREEREALQRVMHTAEPPFGEALLRAVREASL